MFTDYSVNISEADDPNCYEISFNVNYGEGSSISFLVNNEEETCKLSDDKDNVFVN